MSWPPDSAPGLVLGENVSIGEGVLVGTNVVIHDGTILGDNCQVGDRSVIGKPALAHAADPAPRAVIGAGTSVGAECVICAGAHIGKDVSLGDRSFVREDTVIGAGCTIEANCAIESSVRVGERVHLRHDASITSYSTVEDDVLVGANVVTTNDNTMGRHPAGMQLRGPHLKAGSRIGDRVIIVPGRVVGERSMVVANSLVAHDVPAGSVVRGTPARVVDLHQDDALLNNPSAPR